MRVAGPKSRGAEASSQTSAIRQLTGAGSIQRRQSPGLNECRERWCRPDRTLTTPFRSSQNSPEGTRTRKGTKTSTTGARTRWWAVTSRYRSRSGSAATICTRSGGTRVLKAEAKKERTIRSTLEEGSGAGLANSNRREREGARENKRVQPSVY
ncbi:hypothetical protein VTK56DRAFT_7949 [Thermocarpiscus australiensis]